MILHLLAAEVGITTQNCSGAIFKALTFVKSVDFNSLALLDILKLFAYATGVYVSVQKRYPPPLEDDIFSPSRNMPKFNPHSLFWGSFVPFEFNLPF